ncbi:unnamed protein product, partial [Mesorhabditis spiculigera]
MQRMLPDGRFLAWYILTRLTPSICRCVIICLLVYIPSLVQAITFAFSTDPEPAIREILLTKFPAQNWTGTTISGHLSIVNFETLFTILWLCLTCAPVYVVVTIFRNKIHNVLEVVRMSPKTKEVHRQLVKALWLQACLPLLFSGAVICYAVEQLQIVQHPLLEYLVFHIVGLVPVIAPFLSLYFVSPYRRAIKRFLHIGKPGKTKYYDSASHILPPTPKSSKPGAAISLTTSDPEKLESGGEIIL